MKTKKRKEDHSILKNLSMLNNKFIFSIRTLIRFLNLKKIQRKLNSSHENEEKGVKL